MMRTALLLALTAMVSAAELRVCATVPELGDLVRTIGGAAVEVTVFARPGDNPHFVDAKPSFIRELARADALVVVGLDLEVGWVPALQRQCRNANVRTGGNGYIDCSAASFTKLQVPDGTLTRAQGDVHIHGNPHYLLDPGAAIIVAAYLAERLAALLPAHRDTFFTNSEAFVAECGARLFGSELCQHYSVESLLEWHNRGTLADHLSQDQRSELLAGWLAQVPADMHVIADHNLWPYFAHRFGLTIDLHLEPKPGIPPSTAHLAQVLRHIQDSQPDALITSPWFDRRHIEFVLQHAQIAEAPLAHQLRSRPGTERYLDFIDYNVRTLAGIMGR